MLVQVNSLRFAGLRWLTCSPASRNSDPLHVTAGRGRPHVGPPGIEANAGRHARAYSLAVLAVEEFGKAFGLLTLAAMPKNLRAQAKP